MKQIVAVLCWLLLSIPAQAITVQPITFEELVRDATAVLYGRVAEVRGRWTADRRSIESIASIEALRYLKGNLGEDVPVRLLGGEAGGFINAMPGAPVLRKGDLVVLFLGAHGPAIPVLVGLTQGVFRVVVDRSSGSAHVVPPALRASAAGRVLRGAVERRALTLDAFASEVRSIVEAQR
jgi:hypothetical protein